MEFPGKKVTVLGLGVSGCQSALFLHKRGFNVYVSDGATTENVRLKVEELSALGIPGEAGVHSPDKILESDWILISPGIPPAAPIYQTIRQAGIPIYSEIEAASYFCPTDRVVAITGTCGKTTVTTLLRNLIASAGGPGKVVACGNIGTPWISEIENLSAQDTVVLELSSFQLEHCTHFRPKIGILLNVSPNHEDWHGNGSAYVNAKLRLFQAQLKSDTALFREQDRQSYFPKYSLNAQTVLFGANPKMNPNEEVLRAVARLMNIPEVRVTETLNAFQGIEHRLEIFHRADGITYINDSKSTTPSSLAWALDKYPDKRVVLIAGGHPKSTNFDTLRDLVARKVKKAVLIGEARELLREAWKGAAPLEEAGAFKDAVQQAQGSAQAGDIVLLSPACASFDMFSNYLERGRLFKEFVLEITGPSANRSTVPKASEGLSHV